MWSVRIFAGVVILSVSAIAHAQIVDLDASYQFLVSDRNSGGLLYTATSGVLRGQKLPLSFYDTPEYWGEYVCKQQGVSCAVTDTYDRNNYTLSPPRGRAGELQTERVNVHGGTSIYDAATWQIAVMLGQAVNRFKVPDAEDAYVLSSNQNRLLQLGYSGDALETRHHANRAITTSDRFRYNGHAIENGNAAYSFRMLSRSWLAVDPFVGTRYASLINASGLPKDNLAYQVGKITWTDWKPITGENAWAFLLGPLHAAYLHFVIEQHGKFVPFNDASVQNALVMLPTFAAMQSGIGGVYSVPSGTLANYGDQLINPHQVSVENNASLYAGLRVLESTLRAELKYEKNLGTTDLKRINGSLSTIMTMIDGGRIDKSRSTDGLLAFFRRYAWQNNEFVQGGFANDPTQRSPWVPALKPRAVDANTWSIAALGPKQIDQWFGFGAAYTNWQQVKSWGAFGEENKLWGVGFSDEDGNGMESGIYRQGILSAEWTAGAINMVRLLIEHYELVPKESPDYTKSRSYIQRLKTDEASMLVGIHKLRMDHYVATSFPGKPSQYEGLAFRSSKSYLYASKRYFIPFGWYANPLPSACATAWVMMLADHFNPFAYGGGLGGNGGELHH